MYYFEEEDITDSESLDFDYYDDNYTESDDEFLDSIL